MILSNDYKSIRLKLRNTILDLHYTANAGHVGCSLSCIDLLIATLIIQKQENDTVILSKGHAASALYACLNYKGEILDEQLKTFYKNGTELPAHPAPNKFKNIPFATGSLGHGFSIAAGIAKANKLIGNKNYSYVIMSDGETNEGTTWEAAHFSVRHQLNNLIVLIDKNKLQGFDETANVLGDTCKPEHWLSFGFDVATLNGHDIAAIIEQINKFKTSTNNKPKVIIADTVKGKGVSYMENKLEWHYLSMSESEYARAKEDIKICSNW